MFSLPDLPYDYDALAPAISQQIMRLHHDQHHRIYLEKLNAAIREAPELAGRSLIDLLKNLDDLPKSVQIAIRHNGGGHYNHSAFWRWLTPHGDGEPTGQLKDDLLERYTTFQNFVDQFQAAATGLFGSGWVWLLPDLTIQATGLQDVPLEFGEPVLGLDVWEHAYYLDYTFRRADYVAAWWPIVNWPEAVDRYSRQKPNMLQ